MELNNFADSGAIHITTAQTCGVIPVTTLKNIETFLWHNDFINDNIVSLRELHRGHIINFMEQIGEFEVRAMIEGLLFFAPWIVDERKVELSRYYPRIEAH